MPTGRPARLKGYPRRPLDADGLVERSRDVDRRADAVRAVGVGRGHGFDARRGAVDPDSAGGAQESLPVKGRQDKEGVVAGRVPYGAPSAERQGGPVGVAEEAGRIAVAHRVAEFEVRVAVGARHVLGAARRGGREAEKGRAGHVHGLCERHGDVDRRSRGVRAVGVGRRDRVDARRDAVDPDAPQVAGRPGGGQL